MTMTESSAERTTLYYRVYRERFGCFPTRHRVRHRHGIVRWVTT